MTLKQAIQDIPGFRFVVENLEINSAPGRRFLSNMEMKTDAREIDTSLCEIEEMAKWIKATDYSIIRDISALLMRLKDIESTLKRLSSGECLDDIELFEVKSFIIIAEGVRTLAQKSSVPGILLPDLSDALHILDPENTGTPYFYIYDAYDERLHQLRVSMRALDPESAEAIKLFCEASSIESLVRSRLSANLNAFHSNINVAYNALAALDVLMAKAMMAKKFGMCRPVIQKKGNIDWIGLFNPMVKDSLAKTGKTFQPVDFSVAKGATLVTGANMGGKSVLLKTLALAQVMVQFGFYAPAMSGSLIAVKNIILCIGDGQNELTGLSSFAYEMLAIDRALKIAKEQPDSLILIDEPARTTNPEEGKAITDAILGSFSDTGAMTVVTSHYSGLSALYRFRVRGLKTLTGETCLSPSDISRLMDYSLIADSGDNTPKEALRIAALIGIDKAIINRAKHHLSEK